MAIDQKTRTKLIALFEGVDYRQIVSKAAGCHPNTVSNVLTKGTDNPIVELQLLVLAQNVQPQKDEEYAIRKKARWIAKQL